MKRLTAVLAVMLCVPAFADKPAKPKEAPKDSIKWATSWDAALKEAQERNVPIHVAFHKDH